MLRVFHGPMCSGKTHKLLSLVENECSRYLQIQALKPLVDTRVPAPYIRSRTGKSLRVDLALSSLREIKPKEKSLYVVDEAQFFSKVELLEFSDSTLRCGSSIFVAGLDFDYKRQEFGGVLALARMAQNLPQERGGVESLQARCCHPGCGAPAPYTQRLNAGGENLVVVGGEEYYRPACPLHHSLTPVSGDGWTTLR